MSSPYPILDNRPIDKWKVTELKEELKKRKLTTRGLKEDLIKRLDEALRVEKENDEKEELAAEEDQECLEMTPPKASEATPVAAREAAVPIKTPPAAVETTPVHANVEDNIVKDGGDEDKKVDDGLDDSMVDLKQQEAQEENVKDETVKVESKAIATDPVVAEASNDILLKSDTDSKNNEDNIILDNATSASIKQVSEVSPVSGLEVKSDCISTDSVSNNEKIKLKDNVIADNVKLEHNINKTQEMVDPPSSIGGESHPMDVEDPHELKASVGDKDGSNAANDDIEKLNLDRSSGEDSMEEETDVKNADSNHSDEAVNKSADDAETLVKVPENHSEKRKLPVADEEAVGNNEPVKRQRRWNSENVKVPEAKLSNVTPTMTTPKPIGLNRNFSRSDSTASDDGPKERVVPASKKDPTNTLRIDNFVRPFTLKAVQELLGKTGSVTSFWMDHIKTHCYVSYSSVEEAIATRNAVYNIQWPPNGGRLLVAEFVDPDEGKAKTEGPLSPAALMQPPVAERQEPLLNPPPASLPNPTPARERLQPPPPPPPAAALPAPELQEPPIVTLDELFRKTKAMPRIYYLPLSDEQVAAKLAAQGNGNGARK